MNQKAFRVLTFLLAAIFIVGGLYVLHLMDGKYSDKIPNWFWNGGCIILGILLVVERKRPVKVLSMVIAMAILGVEFAAFISPHFHSALYHLTSESF
jgi:hypothetical protein